MSSAGGDGEPEEFMARLDPGDRAALVERGRQRRWPVGASLFLEGERSATVMVVVSGRVKVFSLTEEGEEVVLAVRGPGALLGELSAIDGAPRDIAAELGVPVGTVKSRVFYALRGMHRRLERPGVLL